MEARTVSVEALIEWGNGSVLGIRMGIFTMQNGWRSLVIMWTKKSMGVVNMNNQKNILKRKK